MPTPIRIVDGVTATDELGRPVASMPIRFVDEPIATNELGQPVDAMPGEIVDTPVVATADGRMVGSVPVRVVAGLTTVNEVGNRVAVAPVWLGGDVPPDPDPEYPRTAWTNATRSIHSGHSLTDAYAHYGPWPGCLRNIAGSIGITLPETKFTDSVIPGSWIKARYDADAGMDPGFRAYSEINQYDALMITEAGPPPHYIADRPFLITETLDYLCRYAANTIENGRSNEVILWSIWPSLGGPGWNSTAPAEYPGWTGRTFREALPDYGHTFKFMADYVTWKMRQLYPALPADWRVWIGPGHRWMMRVYDDMQNGDVPGYTTMDELFEVDTGPDGNYAIHPTPIGTYGLAALVDTIMYQTNLTTAPDVYIAEAHTAANGSVWPAVTQAQAEYFWEIAWAIATSYEPAGMGGISEAEPMWTEAIDGDLMPKWRLANPDTSPLDPEPGEPEIPADALGLVTPTAVTGFTFAPALPAAVGGYRTLTVQHDSSATGIVYTAIRVKRNAENGPIFAVMATHPNDWEGNQILAAGNAPWGSINAIFLGGPEGEMARTPDGWLGLTAHIVEFWHDAAAETVNIAIDGGGTVSEALSSSPVSAFGHLFLNQYADGFDIFAITAMARVPTTEERAGIRAALEEA